MIKKYRIKCISRNKYENGSIARIENEYIIQYKFLYFWKDYKFKYCKTPKFLTEEDTIKAIDTIKKLYKGTYQRYPIEQSYNGKYYCPDIYSETFISSFETLQGIKDFIDNINNDDNITYIKI